MLETPPPDTAGLPVRVYIDPALSSHDLSQRKLKLFRVDAWGALGMLWFLTDLPLETSDSG